MALMFIPTDKPLLLLSAALLWLLLNVKKKAFCDEFYYNIPMHWKDSKYQHQYIEDEHE